MQKINSQDNRFHNGDGRTTQGTIVTAEWLNAVQDEVCGVIEKLGGVVNPESSQQMGELLVNKFAPLESPVFTGSPKAPNPTDKSADNQIATVKFVKSAVENVQVSEATQDEKGIVSLAQIQENSIPVGAVVGFPENITNPQGYLRADGSTFGAQTYPQLYAAMGNKNKLPNIQPKSDIGVTAYFATDAIPDGWIAFDDIATIVTQATYPELYAALVAQYGSISAVPKADDRFIRNAANGLSVGQVQEDEFKAHKHRYPLQTNRTVQPTWFDEIEDDTATTTIINVTVADSGHSDNSYGKFKGEYTAEGGTETRPKSLVLKLCIKAKSSFDSVIYWVKAFGSVTNAGQLDAGKLAQDLQGKADKSHFHTTNEITDFTAEVNNVINAGFTYQKIGDFEIRKYPDGTMIQTCVYHRGSLEFSRYFNESEDIVLIYPISFIEMPIANVMAHLSHGHFEGQLATNDKTKPQASGISEANDGLVGLTENCSNTAIGFIYRNDNVYISEMSFHIIAIGRWK